MKVIQYNYALQNIPEMDLERADLVFADPPYNQGVRYMDDDTRDRTNPADYRDLMGRALNQLYNVMRPGATLWWLCPVDQVDWIGQALVEFIGPRLYLIAWNERFSQYQGTRGLTKDFRLLFVHQKNGGTTTWNPNSIRIESERQRLGDPRANPDGRVPGTVWPIRRLQGTSTARVAWHPTQLAPELLDRIILGWTNVGDTVLDAFAGSGSMGVRCLEYGRRFVGIDKSASYCQLMKERLLCGSPAG